MVLNAENIGKSINLFDDENSNHYAGRALGLPETTVVRANQGYRDTWTRDSPLGPLQDCYSATSISLNLQLEGASIQGTTVWPYSDSYVTDKNNNL